MKVRIEDNITSRSCDWIDEYYDRIYPVILRMVANEEVAKDLTQDAFLKAWEKQESFRGDSDMGTWLYRIAVNLTLTYLSRNKRTATSPIEEAIIPEKKDGVQSKMEQLHEGDIVREAISELPPAYRVTIIMHYYDDMKLSTIAEKVGISRGTAAWRLFKARKMMTQSLKSKGINL